MQNINHGKYINYLILQPNSGIDVLQEGKGNSLFPEGLRQGMIKKQPHQALLCSRVLVRYKSLFICQ